MQKTEGTLSSLLLEVLSLHSNICMMKHIQQVSCKELHTWIIISIGYVDDDGITQFATVLKVNSTMKKLNNNVQGITKNGAKSLGS